MPRTARQHRPGGGPKTDSGAQEHLDGDHLSFEETRRALEDLSRVNRWLWGYRPVLRTVLPRVKSTGGRPWVLDLGTGSGDVAARLQRRTRSEDEGMVVVGVDRKLRHLVLGRRRHPDQLRVVACAKALPFADQALDWSFSTLFFHHFDAAANRDILAEMRRVSRRGAMIVDLRRSRILSVLIRPLLALLGCGPHAREDGRISVAASWSLGDVAHVVGDHPIRRLRRRFPFRFSLELEGTPAPAPEPTP